MKNLLLFIFLLVPLVSYAEVVPYDVLAPPEVAYQVTADVIPETDTIPVTDSYWPSGPPDEAMTLLPGNDLISDTFWPSGPPVQGIACYLWDTESCVPKINGDDSILEGSVPVPIVGNG